jgi:hypothetical protein
MPEPDTFDSAELLQAAGKLTDLAREHLGAPGEEKEYEAYLAGVCSVVAELLEVSYYEAVALVEALGEQP